MSMYVTESKSATAPRQMVANILFLDGRAAPMSLGELEQDRSRYFGWIK